MEFLKITVPYAIRPESRAFALLGTRHHERLAGGAIDDDTISEELFEGDTYKGHPDYLEGTTLWDYKTWGSYRVTRFLGLVSEKIDDPTGAVYEKSGKWGRAGSIKQVNLWTRSPLMADTHEPTLQLNAYRLVVEQHGYPVESMRLQITVRDGGLQISRQRGVDKLIYVEDVERLEDVEVEEYFSEKAECLLRALEFGNWHGPCTQDERWDDQRCREYCEVAFACEHGKEVLASV